MPSARAITTKREALSVMFADGSPKVLGAGMLAAAAVRSRSGRLGKADAASVATVIALRPFVEWGLHRYVLHGKVLHVSNRSFDVAAGHRAHHRVPDEVDQVLLGTRYAVADGGVLALVVASAGAAIASVVGTDRRQVAATTAGGALGALMAYEWVHLLVHTGYRPHTRWLRRLKSHHRLHHFRDETMWLGVTSTLADKVFRTAPSAGSDLRSA
jgi:hypothetical protein